MKINIHLGEWFLTPFKEITTKGYPAVRLLCFSFILLRNKRETNPLNTRSTIT